MTPDRCLLKFISLMHSQLGRNMSSFVYLNLFSHTIFRYLFYLLSLHSFYFFILLLLFYSHNYFLSTLFHSTFFSSFQALFSLHFFVISLSLFPLNFFGLLFHSTLSFYISLHSHYFFTLISLHVTKTPMIE